MQVFAPKLFDGDTALVTGGGTGIGLACARQLGKLGARLVIASRSETHLLPAADELAAAGVEVLAKTCDIREPEQIDELMAAIDERFGSLDILINNAGGQFPSPAIALKPKGWAAVIRNNLNGTFFVTSAAAQKFFIPAQSGRIVNVIANVFRGFPGMAHTGAARAGVENLTKTLAVEWVNLGIRINAVAPGVIASSGMAQYPQEMVDMSRRAIPMKRLGSVEEVSHAVVFLASSAATYVTGETFYVDGGARLWGDSWPIPDPEED